MRVTGSLGPARRANLLGCSYAVNLDREVPPMRGSGMIWTIVGILLIVALLIWIIPRL